MVESSRDRGANKDEQTDQIDDAENHNRLIFAEVLVSNDGTDDGSNWLWYHQHVSPRAHEVINEP